MNEPRYPRIHLAIDNCFAIKRWVEPSDWMRIIKEIGGIRYIEASTDNEIDPLQSSPSFRDDWVSEIKRLEKELDLKVASFIPAMRRTGRLGLPAVPKASGAR